jgi:hypothetical protein
MYVAFDNTTRLWVAYAAPGVKLFARYTLAVLLAVLDKRGYVRGRDYAVPDAA